jgi:hypothetical protein
VREHRMRRDLARQQLEIAVEHPDLRGPNLVKV